MGLLTGKTAIVTGAARGIGKAIALKFAAEGANVAFTDLVIDENGLNTEKEIAAFGVKAKGYASNAASFEDTEKVVAQIKEEFGSIDILVNNAGVAPLVRDDLLSMSEESLDRLYNINLKGTFMLTQAAAKLLIERKTDNPKMIINVTSISAETSSINRGEYCISKAGLSMVTKLFADRLAEHGINVYELRPGIIETDMTSKVKDKYEALIEGGLLPIRRMGVPEDIAKAVYALTEGYFTYTTGSVMNIDGGFTLSRL